MATYAELLLASENPTLLNKLRVAVVIAANTIRTEDSQTVNHENRLKWAKLVFDNPLLQAQKMLWVVLAQHAAVELNVILSADDATVQVAVDNAINVFAVGE